MDRRRLVGMVEALDVASSPGTWNAAEGTKRRRGEGGVGNPEVLRLSRNGWSTYPECLVCGSVEALASLRVPKARGTFSLV